MTHADFRNPDKTYRPAPFWSWNGKMEPAEVKRQAELLHEQGFGGYFMHSRVGLESPYMGEEWMSAIAAAIDAAVHFDMEAWFYDEDKWPSGFAGGMVPALGDEYRIKGLEARVLNATDLTQAWNQPGAGLLAGALRAIYRLEISGKHLSSFIRLNAIPQTEDNGLFMLCQMRTALPGQIRFNGQSYVDLMSPEVTEAFIKCTHEAYKARFGHLFGPNVPGIFTDEPNISASSGATKTPWPLTPWTTALPTRFIELWGYDLLQYLPLLFLEGDGCRQVRHDYWATITHLFRDNFSKPYGAWCERNNVIMTGHYLREDNPIIQTQYIGAAMPHYPFQQLPGIDHLGRNINNPLTLKQVSSVAHQMGRKRVLCEIFGVAGHSMSFADQKWMSDFHFALGITFLNQHLTLYSMLGERKRDFPANISWAQPYWKDYHLFNDYAARCSWFNQRGDFRADILLLHPMGTVWSLIPGKSDAPSYNEEMQATERFQDKFLSVFNTLLADHRDFDLGDEMVMADYAALAEDKLQVGQMQYKAVVLPYCAVLQPKTKELLRSFIDAGGAVYLVGDNVLADTLTGVIRVADPQVLVSALNQQLERLVSISGADGKQAAQILYHQRTEAERQLYFLANTKLYEAADLRVEIAAKGDVTVFEPTTGNIVTLGRGDSSPFPWAAVQVLESDTEIVVLQWQAPPAGSLMFSVGIGTDAATCVSDPTQELLPTPEVANSRWYAGFPNSLSAQECHTLAGPWRFSRLHPNVFTLDYCRASIAGEPMSGEYKPTPAMRAKVLEACGRTTQIQPYQYLTGQVPSQPIPVQLEFTVNIEALPSELALVVEQPDKLQVRINGTLVMKRAIDAAATDLAYAWLGDPGFGALDISAFVCEGENSITISFIASADGGEVEEIYLLGKFGVWNRNGKYVVGKEPETLSPGSWVDQGYPFYSGTMRYELDVDGSCHWLDLSAAVGSLLRVSVNGGPETCLPWRPWVVDMSNSLAAGPNKVQVDVVSTLRNTFGPLHHSAGDPHSVGPGSFMVHPNNWSDDYQFFAYGLLGPVRTMS